MKRWQSKNDRFLIGGLFLLLLAGTFPWTNEIHLELGSANLSAMKKPQGITIDEDDEMLETTDKADDGNAEKTEGKKKKSSAKNKISAKEVKDEETEDSLIRRQFQLGEKILEATYETSEEDDSKTLVTLAPRNLLEGQACSECKTYEVNYPLDRGEISNIKTINLAIKDSIKKDQKKKKRITIAAKEKTRKPIAIDDESDSNREEDPIRKACKTKKGKDSYTLCAMKELGRLANITGDDEYDASELETLFETHIFRNLQSQLKDRRNVGRQDEAKTAISNLVEKLDDSNSDGLRTLLTKLKQIPLILEAQQLANLERESKVLGRTNPKRAIQVLNEFNLRRWNFERTLNEDLYDTALTYENLVGDTFSRDRAMLQFYDNFVDPITPYRDALWSSDPFNYMRGLNSPNGIGPSGNLALRGARDSGRGAFPPIGQSGGPFPSRGVNNRSLPQPGSPFNRGGVPGPNGFPNNNGISSRFSAPVSSPLYQQPGYSGSRFGAANVLAPYNQPAAGYGRPYGFSSPGYMGYNGPGVRPPVLNSGNYYTGYAGCQANPYAYRPNLNGSFAFQGCGQGVPFPQAGLPYGAPGLSAARPRF